MDKQFDDGMVEALAKALYDEPPTVESETGIVIFDALLFEQAPEDTKQHFRDYARQVLTALSQTYAIVAKWLMKDVADSIKEPCHKHSWCDGCAPETGTESCDERAVYEALSAYRREATPQ